MNTIRKKSNRNNGESLSAQARGEGPDASFGISLKDFIRVACGF